ncbi:MAG: outer membrane lipoprotein LolB [Proteobacteria bacterium]|nr:outer membrane lipoprotein LolB [Pseudomonadota bacterium]
MLRLGRALAPALLASALLGACATPPGLDAAMPWTSGRVALRVDASAERPAHALTADFELRGDAERGELRLSGALGGRLATTRWSAGEAVLDTGQGERRYPDLESLSRDALGEALPLRALPDWLAGRPWRGAASQAQADGFVQLGWAVSLAGFAEGRIDAVREAPPRVTVRVRLERAAAS